MVSTVLLLLLLKHLLLREIDILVPVKLPPQYLIQEYLLLIGGLHIIIKVALATAGGCIVGEQPPLLPQGVIPAATTTSSLREQAAVHHFVHLRALAI